MNIQREAALAAQRANETSAPRIPSPRAHILFAFGVALALYTAWHVREELVLLYVSALFAVVLMPVVRLITGLHIGRWSPGRGLAILLLLIVVAGAATLFFAFALPPVIRDLHEFLRELPTRGPQLLARIRKLPFAQRVDVNSLNAKLQDFASNFATYLFYSIKNWAGALAQIVTGVILTIYFMLEGETAYRWLLSFFPVEQRQRLDTTLARAEVRMGKWLLGQGLLMLILGVCSTVTYSLLHIRYAYALGVLTGLLNIIPFVGALISICLAILVAAIDSWGHVIGVAIFYAIYSQVETSVLTPRIMRTSVDLAGLAVIVALLLGSALAGVIGAMVAVPTAVLVAVLLNEYAVKPDAIIETPQTLK
ncbi:AI-2E family transporter [Silvibacterium dinghuense]|uniref:AI-2E family transporter n=1 Tax=Silvibacterium dinghuense TaxID=1560006 RepID=A0A4Q1SE13_9BACT|nr:AI-2E family transporter [Silvibacterium dinghuense]RXS95347.1 AI-2E family transporter [Silvibacterium dinghuense]GGH12560.1 AI-2E family transporter [Silvibacterium dinghuense]